jgi:CheY-like chemotaxis protein
VSTELVDEMKSEIKKGNYDEVNVIADDVKQNLEKINHHGQRAADIVKGMLQHSRSSSGVKEPTDINALADEYFRLAYHGLRAKDKTFNSTMKTDFDESIGKINIIPQDIGRVVLNLITNAFYAVNEKSKQGIADYEPTVSVSTKKVKHQVEIRVTDNGNGIPANIVDKIFQPFFTTKPTGQGTGLGLSIVSRLVELFDSKIYLESEENVGTTFTFTIGFEHDEDKSIDIINNIEVDLSTSSLYSILVVEDNKINQVVTKKIIQSNNMSCTIVDDGYAALVALEREAFDLILMDINMPLINGFNTTRKIREKGIKIPIIALTAFDKDEVTEEAISAGMNDILVKPFEPSKLFQVIANQIKQKENDS